MHALNAHLHGFFFWWKMSLVKLVMLSESDFFFGGWGGGQMFSSRVEASAFQRLLSWDSNPCIHNQTVSYRNWFLLFEWHSLDDRWTKKSNFHDIYKDVIETHEVSENEALLLAKREPFNVIAVPI